MNRESAKHYGYDYNIPLDEFFQFGISVDCVIFGHHKGKVKVMLIKRGAEPFKGKWALPGDLVYPNEEIDVAARRVLTELTGLKDIFMNQIRAFGGVERHSLGRVVTVGYYALIELDKFSPKPSGWAEDVSWVEINEMPNLAFDHSDIYKEAKYFLKESLKKTTPQGFELLPEKFTLLQYLQMTEYVLGETIDKANFRKKLKAIDFLKPLSEMESNVNHRPAKLYTLDKNKINY